jgi:cell division septal protein FtsQ
VANRAWMATVSRPGRSRAAVLPFPGAELGTGSLQRLLPSGRALLLGFAMLGAAALAYLGARETSVFAVRSIEVRGAPPRVARHVEAALRSLEGTSLVALQPADVSRRLQSLSDVAAFSYDRAFPHSLRVFISPAQSIAVVRQGARAWVIASDGRIVRETGVFAAPRLPRIWVPTAAAVSVGSPLADPAAARAVATVVAARAVGLGARIGVVSSTDQELKVVLASGLELRLGSASDLPLKFTIARRILPLAGPVAYVDVSVPERPIAGGKAKVGG